MDAQTRAVAGGGHTDFVGAEVEARIGGSIGASAGGGAIFGAEFIALAIGDAFAGQTALSIFGAGLAEVDFSDTSAIATRVGGLAGGALSVGARFGALAVGFGWDAAWALGATFTLLGGGIASLTKRAFASFFDTFIFFAALGFAGTIGLAEIGIAATMRIFDARDTFFGIDATEGARRATARIGFGGRFVLARCIGRILAATVGRRGLGSGVFRDALAVFADLVVEAFCIFFTA